ncbi:hypothetical protein FRC03_002758 [Tulasnella sp. 419]|nr:hypothetical protein FRC03_002758 [Tulasnella sp. 419]
MAGRKRTAAAAAVDGDSAPARPAKTSKTSDAENDTKKTRAPASRSKPISKGETSKSETVSKSKPESKKATTTVLSAATFKEHALPLHIHVTHTPPTSTEPGSSSDPTPKMSADPGHIASLTLVPTTFSTGSFGWKGSRRVEVELMNAESGKKEKVMVMMSFNASVVGSKPAVEEKASGAKGGRKTRARKAKKSESEDEDDEDEEY